MSPTPAITSRKHFGSVSRAGRIVIKIGSSSLTGPDGRLDTQAIHNLVEVLAERHKAGGQVVLVSSGAVAAAIEPLGLPTKPRDLVTSQAAASVGQGLLVAEYTRAFAEHGIIVGQVLLTAQDTVRRVHYRNAQRALTKLLDLGVIPIVNENDTVATDEISFGDNDRLAALVSHLIHADGLVLLTDVEGLLSAPPGTPDSKLITTVTSAEDLEGVAVTPRGSSVGTGGMETKVLAAKIATSSGVSVVLTSAENVQAAFAGEDVGTFFVATRKRASRRLLWLEHAAEPRGQLFLDSGAVRAVVEKNSSLLPAGVTAVRGKFAADDPVSLVSQETGQEIARGLVNYSSKDIPKLLGRTTSALGAEFGPGYDRVLVHKNSLVINI